MDQRIQRFRGESIINEEDRDSVEIIVAVIVAEMFFREIRFSVERRCFRNGVFLITRCFRKEIYGPVDLEGLG